MNKSSLECLLGSISSLQRQTYPHPTGLSYFFVKQAPNPRDLYLKQEPNVKTMWHDIRIMVSHMRLIAPFATSSVPPCWCANPSHQRTEKLEDGLHHYGNFWPQSCKKFSLTGMPKVISLSLPLMYDHKSSAFAIAETVLENQCSNLHHQDTTNFSISLLLICVNLVSLNAVLRLIVSEANNPAQNCAATV